jgi:transcription elongation factor Elf1
VSPKEICPRCGKKRLFHADEVKGARKGKVVCLDCGLEETYYLFLGEVLDGQHSELIAELKEQLEDEA